MSTASSKICYKTVHEVEVSCISCYLYRIDMQCRRSAVTLHSQMPLSSLLLLLAAWGRGVCFGDGVGESKTCTPDTADTAVLALDTSFSSLVKHTSLQSSTVSAQSGWRHASCTRPAGSASEGGFGGIGKGPAHRGVVQAQDFAAQVSDPGKD